MTKTEKLKKEIESLEKQLNDPNTPQGDINSLSNRINSLKHQYNIVDREEYEKKNDVRVYGSDDYIGLHAGKYHFYYGYEISECPVKSHKDDDDCYEKNCDKREWCFTVDENGKEIYKKRASELKYYEADDIERVLLVGIARFLKDNKIA